jgi:hypothetical protein
MSITERLQELRTQIDLEQNPIKKREMLEQLLQIVEERFNRLLQLLDKEENPERLRVLATELSEIIKERKGRARAAGSH